VNCGDSGDPAFRVRCFPGLASNGRGTRAAPEPAISCRIRAEWRFTSGQWRASPCWPAASPRPDRQTDLTKRQTRKNPPAIHPRSPSAKPPLSPTRRQPDQLVNLYRSLIRSCARFCTFLFC